MPPAIFLATTADKSSRLFAETLPWLILLLGVVIAGGVIIFIARRYMNTGASGSNAGFTLQDLRELHAAGQIDDAEFARAKALMIGRMTAAKSAADSADGDSQPGNQPSSQAS